ncbi:MAG: hypothetical protein K0Q46_4636 [Rhodococcus erythropolis]|nr:hypothetical protein [Rhodococcus erythropolis]
MGAMQARADRALFVWMQPSGVSRRDSSDNVLRDCRHPRADRERRSKIKKFITSRYRYQGPPIFSTVRPPRGRQGYGWENRPSPTRW